MVKIIIGKHILQGNVAITEEDHYYGLKNEPDPSIMIFPYFNKIAIHKFWMQDTPQKLDILFCKNGKILAIEEGEPFSLRHIGPNEPTDLIIEMPYGMTNYLKIGIGELVKIEQSISIIAANYAQILNL